MEQKQYYITHEEFLKLRAAWKILADTKQVKAPDVIIYNLLRNLPAKRGFSPTSEEHIQGNDVWYGFENAKHSAWWSVRTPWKEHKFHNKKDNDEKFEKKYGLVCPPDFEEKVAKAGHE